MNDDTSAQVVQPYSGLKGLNKLAGTWNVSGPDINGQVKFEWMQGGFFLMQQVDFVHGGRHITGIEIIGYELPFGAEKPSEQIKSHWFGSTGETFEYTYEVDDETLTIWGGEKGSPAYYKGKWIADGDTNSGAWVYPDGGGYQSNLSRA